PITFGGVFAFAVLLMLKAGHGGSSASAKRTHSLQREGGQSSPPARIATFSETLQPFQERTAARRRPRRATADQADRSPGAARSIGRRQCPSPGEEDGEVRLSALVVAERRPAGGEQVRVLGEVEDQAEIELELRRLVMKRKRRVRFAADGERLRHLPLQEPAERQRIVAAAGPGEGAAAVREPVSEAVLEP